ncbi:MAG: cytochrome c biogenesis protein CcsA [Methylacidiphilales bacterium]|nr:cytochrome c biogenesis protein CcsA [Candidatus Methylacidiphilales bacterium]MDW8349469.1 cytochrome c biogenesis protein CcsA [Verrucomicrobiae bacterium]
MKSYIFLITLLTLTIEIHASSHSVRPTSNLWSELAVQHNGRKKPFTSFAHEITITITGKTYWPPIQKNAQRLSALQGTISLFLEPAQFHSATVIYIGYSKLKNELGLDPQTIHFSISDIIPNARLATLLREAELMRFRNPREPLPRLHKEAEELAQRLSTFEALLNGSLFKIIPHPTLRNDGSWLSINEISNHYPSDEADALRHLFEKLREAYLNSKPEFGTHLKTFITTIHQLRPSHYADQTKLKAEYLYKEWHPSGWAWKLYLAAAAVLFFIRNERNRGLLYRASWLLLIIGFLLQIIAFALRVYVSGRAPVTNMYETVIWVALGTMAFAIFFEARYQTGYFILAAAPFASIVLILADLSPIILDRSIQPLQPVLRNNFWLTVHVLTVTLSYAAFLLAMALAHIRLIRHLLRYVSDLDAKLDFFVYRALQIGVFLLAAGTILGGVWANYSWGRFWDWDPKETWALITLLIYLAVLHGRLAGWWKGLGLSVGSIVGFLSVIMTWYGVNFILGKGLHSYGFGKGGGTAVTIFVLSQILLLLALLLQRLKSKVTKR